MLAPFIKKKVDKLWDRFWAAGLTNPLVAVEQITYLIFLKRLEAIDSNRADEAKKTKREYRFTNHVTQTLPALILRNLVGATFKLRKTKKTLPI